ncbi:hypothetical protein GGR62_002271 [Xanthomonas campestris]|nr:hypothetical protein [Xanthomonas sp. 3075]
MTAAATVITTPDGRYLIVRGRLWRAANPHLSERARAALVGDLMDACREVKAARGNDDAQRLASARHAVQMAKVALGERGPVWWTDGSQDVNRHLVRNTPYAGLVCCDRLLARGSRRATLSCWLKNGKARSIRALPVVCTLGATDQLRSQLLGCGQVVAGSMALTAAGAVMPISLAP